MLSVFHFADPGIFEFEKPSFLVKESVEQAQIPVTRINGCDGRVTLTWRTEDVTAVSGKDYEGGEGTLVFEHGETAKMIEIPVHNDLVSRRKLYFASYNFLFRVAFSYGCNQVKYIVTKINWWFVSKLNK